MMRRLISMLLAAALLFCVPASLAQQADYDENADIYYIESTSLSDASSKMLNNIDLAIELIDGIYIPYGDTFSFNDCVGPRTEKRGFVSARNGRGVKVMGGGVAQVASTIYLTLLQIPGIVYNEVNTYGDRFTGGYVSDGELAIVTDYEAGTDFSFDNYEGDMILQIWEDGDDIYCQIDIYNSYEKIGYDEDYTLVSSSSFRLTGSAGLKSNVTRAAGSIDGTVISSYETFSFNEIVGPRTKSYGYVTARNGRGVDVTGGGVAQVASVIWLAVQDMYDITIIEKTTYGKRYTEDYVSYSSDAIVTDYSADTDFSFRYDGDYSLTFAVYVEDGYLCCDVYESSGLSW